MVLVRDVLQGSRTRAATAAMVGGVTGGEEDMKTEWACRGVERKVVGPPVTYEGRDGLGGTELMGTTQGNYGVTREVPAHCCGYSVQEKHNNFHIVADKKR
jgi:hypothetical protein